MNRAKLTDLESVTEAVFQRQFQTLKPVLEAEARVNTQLARLDAQVQQVRADSAEAEGYRVTGTDLLWNGWESATRRQLHSELARIRAQKLAALDALKSAFGRKEAVAELSKAVQKAHRITAAGKQSAQ